MRLELESGRIIDQPTPNDIRSAILAEEFVILSHEDQRYMQCAVNKGELDSHILEYRDGGDEEHYQTANPVTSAHQLITAFQKYLAGDESWKTDFQWVRLTHEAQQAQEWRKPGCFSVLVAILMILAMTTLVIGIGAISAAAEQATSSWFVAPADDRSSPEIMLTGPREIGPVRLWVPEAVMSVPGAAAIYPQATPWVRERGSWRQTSKPDALFAKQQVQRVDERTIEFHKLRLEWSGPVKWETEVQARGDAVAFSIKLANTGPREIKQAAAAICVKFLEGKRWWNAEQTYVLCDDRLRQLTALGHTESRFYRPNPFQLYLLRDTKFDNPFYHQVWGVNEHRLSRPLMISQHRESGLCVVVSADRACFLHCNRSNPCTDLMLAFGDLKPGQSAESRGQVQWWRGTAADFVAKTSDKTGPLLPAATSGRKLEGR